jgi:transposase-like protein
VEGVWVLGGVERTARRKIFLAVVPCRNAETLTAVIRRFVKPGSLIYSDCWRAYSGLEDEEGMRWVHEVVNHSVEFVTEDGVHTNSIEGMFY